MDGAISGQLSAIGGQGKHAGAGHALALESRSLIADS
jgi:hypothetical protein